MKTKFIPITLLLFILTHVAATPLTALTPSQLEQLAQHRSVFTTNNRGEEGVKFSCDVTQLHGIEQQLSDYFSRLGIQPALIKHNLDPSSASLLLTLATPETDTSTLDFRFRPELGVRDQQIHLPIKGNKTRTVLTVSEKEIVLALMQHGRLTEFSGERCSAQAFIDHVKIRQNTVAWAESLRWEWPDGERAKWNNKYWHKGTPLPHVSVSAAVADAFINQDQYGIGCYTATKLVLVQGILDYYRRIKKSPLEFKKIEQRLMMDREPLVHIEPPAMWWFEDDFDFSELWDKGEILEMQYNIPPQNLVPGDWVYIRNTDPKTQNKIGYEGSNAIYLGRGKFDDYYNDHHHSYLLHEKLNEVFQWRNHVFNHIRDVDKIVPLSGAELQALQATPEQGGLLMDMRVYFTTSLAR